MDAPRTLPINTTSASRSCGVKPGKMMEAFAAAHETAPRDEE
jgi:hypothetical protein